MAQYDVFENPDSRQRQAFPYLVVLQSDQLDHYSTRMVMPLMRLPRAPERMPRRLAQRVEVLGEMLYLASHLCAPYPSRLLRGPVCSARADAALFADSLNAVMSGV